MNNKPSLAAPDDPDSWVVPELLIRFMRATTELNRRDLKTEEPLPPQQIRALLYLVQKDGATIKGLAQALCLSEARASRLADELVDSGHVLHERDAIDRRQVRLHVAPAAREKAQRLHRERAGALRAALAGASEDDLQIFAHYLRRIVEEFEALAHRASEAAPAADLHAS